MAGQALFLRMQIGGDTPDAHEVGSHEDATTAQSSTDNLIERGTSNAMRHKCSLSLLRAWGLRPWSEVALIARYHPPPVIPVVLGDIVAGLRAYSTEADKHQADH